MKAGDLNSLVKIQTQTTGQDDVGQPMTTWTDVADVWANILHRSGGESIRAGQDASVVQASIRIRRRSGINAGMRVVHGSAIYSIQAILPDEVIRDHSDLVCERVNG